MLTRCIFLLTALMVSGCLVTKDPHFAESNDKPFDLSAATKVTLWATRYYVYEADESTRAVAVPLRNMKNRVIGPKLSAEQWCKAAIEGTVRVKQKTYNYAGQRNPEQAKCSAHRPSGRVRWKASPFEYGIGSANNPLLPYRTLACDLGTVRNSKPWVNGGFAKFGQKIYVPAAKGAKLPDGSIHDGIFTCGDTGGLIVGNHIDVFTGLQSDSVPFTFIKSSPSKTFEAYVLK